MSSRSGDVSGKHEHVQPKAAESTGRDEARQCSFTQWGYHYMLERKLSSFKKEMTEFKKAIDEANDAYIKRRHSNIRSDITGTRNYENWV